MLLLYLTTKHAFANFRRGNCAVAPLVAYRRFKNIRTVFWLLGFVITLANNQW